MGDRGIGSQRRARSRVRDSHCANGVFTCTVNISDEGLIGAKFSRKKVSDLHVVEVYVAKVLNGHGERRGEGTVTIRGKRTSLFCRTDAGGIRYRNGGWVFAVVGGVTVAVRVGVCTTI